MNVDIPRTAAALAIAGTMLLTSGAVAAADQQLADCAVTDYLLNATGGRPDGRKAPIDDDFSVQRGQWWCRAMAGASTADFGPRGLKLSIAATSAQSAVQGALANQNSSKDNAEVLSVPTAQTGMSMSARIRGADLRDVQGSRGWGFWDRNFVNSAGGTAMAWFLYQYGNGGYTGGDRQGPQGLVVMTQRVGNPEPNIIHLDERLLEQDHTYTVTLEKDAVEYLIDGKLVARVTDPEFIPQTPMLSQAWVDNWYYTNLGQYLPLPQPNSRRSLLEVAWYRQAPTSALRFGDTAGVRLSIASGASRGRRVRVRIANDNEFPISGTLGIGRSGQAITKLPLGVSVAARSSALILARLPRALARRLARRRSKTVQLAATITDRAGEARHVSTKARAR